MKGSIEQAGPEFFEPEVTHYGCFRIGGISVRIIGDSATDVNLLPSLEPFRAKTTVSDIHIHVKWVAALNAPKRCQLFDSGSTWRLYEGDADFQFDFMAAIFGDRPFKRLSIDRRFREASLQMSRDCTSILPHFVEPLGYPLDELLIMHRLTQEKAIELHGCGIVTADGVGNLFVGHSEAGKSTTTRLWTASQHVEVLSDDRIIVRWQTDQMSGQLSMYGTPWHGEAMFASPANAPLKRIMVLEHGYGNKLTRLSPSQAVAELFARSFVPFHRHEYVESALTFLEEVAASVPCYRYSFEPDQGAVDTILNLHD